MSYLSTLQLSSFRSYDAAQLQNLRAGFITLTGANGAGKTNILEAVSLLTPGRGLRRAKPQDMQKLDAHAPWGIHAQTLSGGLPVNLGTGFDPQKNKRITRINGETVKSQNALSDYLSCVWLTPQMDRLFLDGSNARRRFLDRLIFAYDNGHAGRGTRYENALRQRSKLLQDHQTPPEQSWLESLEKQMAETGVAIAAARIDMCARLQDAYQKTDTQNFPAAIFQLHGTIETLLNESTALETEDIFTYQLAQSRGIDAQKGGAATGPHKTDLNVIYADKNMPAAQCSTGEQKALLIGITLAHARLVHAERGTAPILLLDEIAAHLDSSRRRALFDILHDLQTQIWMSGTDADIFTSLPSNHAQHFQIENSIVTA